MYVSLSCAEQGQNQQSRVDLCSIRFPATIVHQGGALKPIRQAYADTVLTVVGTFVVL